MGKIEREQLGLKLKAEAKKLKCNEEGLDGFIYCLPSCLRRAERPADWDMVDAYVALQAAAVSFHNAIARVRREDTKHRYLEDNLKRVEVELAPFLRPNDADHEIADAHFAGHGGLYFSYKSKPGKSAEYGIRLACEAALAWWQGYKALPSATENGQFHKILKFACRAVLELESGDMPGRQAVSEGIELCRQQLDSGVVVGSPYLPAGAVGGLHIVGKKR